MLPFNYLEEHLVFEKRKKKGKVHELVQPVFIDYLLYRKAP